MSSLNNLTVKHYSKENLYLQIIKFFKSKNIDLIKLSLKDLETIDQFHLGGIEATFDLIKNLKINSSTNILDIGSGIGGSVRFIKNKFDANVVGIDLTPEYIEVANKLNKIVGLNNSFQLGNALRIPFNKNYFDIVTLIHVGMNIENKFKLFQEVCKVLKPSGFFAIYDIMIVKKGKLNFPLPWATTSNISFVDTKKKYISLANNLGLVLKSEEVRIKFAMKYIKYYTDFLKSNGSVPQNLSLLMGENAKIKISNLFKAIRKGYLAPVELIFENR